MDNKIKVALITAVGGVIISLISYFMPSSKKINNQNGHINQISTGKNGQNFGIIYGDVNNIKREVK